MRRKGSRVTLIGVVNECPYRIRIGHVDIAPCLKHIMDAVGTFVQPFFGKSAEQGRGRTGIAYSHVTDCIPERLRAERFIPTVFPRQERSVCGAGIQTGKKKLSVTARQGNASRFTGHDACRDAHDSLRLAVRIVTKRHTACAAGWIAALIVNPQAHALRSAGICQNGKQRPFTVGFQIIMLGRNVRYHAAKASRPQVAKGIRDLLPVHCGLNIRRMRQIVNDLQRQMLYIGCIHISPSLYANGFSVTVGKFVRDAFRAAVYGSPCVLAGNPCVIVAHGVITHGTAQQRLKGRLFSSGENVR